MLSLTATDLNRFMKCNGSRLLGKITPVDRDTTLRDEGNAADWFIGEFFKGNYFADDLIDRKADNGVFITGDMVDHCEQYLTDIKGKGDVEVVTTYSDNKSYEIRSRADHIYSEPQTLHISDFKYGWKIVEPEENWTLISHAIGFLQSYATQPQDIVFTIYQPRPYHPDGNVRTWSITYERLMEYWQELHAALTNPSDEIVTGVHCYKCPSMSQCPAAQKAAMNSIDVGEMAYDSEVDNKQLSYIMDEIKRAKTVLTQAEDAYNNLANTRVRSGEIVPGYCMETTLSNAQWKDGMTHEIVQMMTGVDVSTKKIISPTQARKTGISSEVMDSLCERKSTGFKLVRKDVNKRAEQLFGKK